MHTRSKIQTSQTLIFMHLGISVNYTNQIKDPAQRGTAIQFAYLVLFHQTRCSFANCLPCLFCSSTEHNVQLCKQPHLPPTNLLHHPPSPHTMIMVEGSHYLLFATLSHATILVSATWQMGWEQQQPMPLGGKALLENLGIPTYVGIHYPISQGYPGHTPCQPDEKPLIRPCARQFWGRRVRT